MRDKEASEEGQGRRVKKFDLALDERVCRTLGEGWEIGRGREWWDGRWGKGGKETRFESGGKGRERGKEKDRGATGK